MKIRPRPNFSWAVFFVIVSLRYFQILNTWVSVTLFAIYTIVALVVMHNNPKIRKEAEEFGQQMSAKRAQRRKDKLFNALVGSVKIQRKNK
ncbi:hypothetical protein A3E06_03425 [Candidatus Giovannonibacteria bacterium RIFCSPHIGHO2_12_FULL_44_42]|nr:MAG: hypothetical protein A3E06_03425 [Candidatus Giovannonibacteria bacterium RIFCSPHIGHO2_12_FULL_44_42]